MIDPSYGTISDIDPDGGGDYTTLQAWYEDTCGEAAIQHARCHHSDSTDLGELDTSTQNWAYTPTADEPVCIYAHTGDEADGSRDDDNQGAAILAVVTDTSCLAVGWQAVKVAGLRMTLYGIGDRGVLSVNCQSVLIERCTIIIDSAMTTGVLAYQIQSGEVTTAILRNNLVLNMDSANSVSGMFVTTSMGGMLNATFYNNSIVNCTHTALGAGNLVMPQTLGSEVSIVARNNAVADDGTLDGPCFWESGLGTVDWTGSSHNVSSDATADSVVGGSDNIINAPLGDVWADIGDDDAPFAPKVGGELDPPDGVNLFSQGAGGVTTDALGIERPSQGAHYRGGLEIFAGLYKAYGARTRSAVDYGVMLESVRAGTSEIDITGLGLASGGEYWLGVRATSAAGIEETNTDRLTRAVVDEAGDVQPLPLAAVRELTAELQTDGSVIVGFTHTTSPGWATPTEFEVLTDNGTGELDLVTPAATINVTDAGAGDYEAAVAASTLPAKFSARARSGAETGPVAPPVTVSLPAGPAAVEET